MQKVTITVSQTDCDGHPIIHPDAPFGTKTIWETWPYDEEPKGLYAGGEDVFSMSGGGAGTRGTISFDGEYGIVLGKMPIPPFLYANPACQPLTDGPCSEIEPKVSTTAKMRRHAIKVKWDCCDCWWNGRG